jgi:hypothetical protein
MVSSDMEQETEDLFARADAAASEARRLLKINWYWQKQTYAAVRRMRLLAVFEPVARRATYPQDLRLPPPTYRPFPNQADAA